MFINSTEGCTSNIVLPSLFCLVPVVNYYSIWIICRRTIFSHHLRQKGLFDNSVDQYYQVLSNEQGLKYIWVFGRKVLLEFLNSFFAHTQIIDEFIYSMYFNIVPHSCSLEVSIDGIKNWTIGSNLTILCFQFLQMQIVSNMNVTVKEKRSNVYFHVEVALKLKIAIYWHLLSMFQGMVSLIYINPTGLCTDSN